MEKILLDKEFATVTFDDDLKLVKLVWKGRTTHEQYMEAFNTGIDYGKEHEVNLFLSDVRNQQIVSPDSRKWFQAEAIPRAKSFGLKRAAVVLDGNVFKRYYLNHIFGTTKRTGIELQFFKNMEEAMDYLRDFYSL